jgi:hypothetical protein
MSQDGWPVNRDSAAIGRRRRLEEGPRDKATAMRCEPPEQISSPHWRSNDTTCHTPLKATG